MFQHSLKNKIAYFKDYLIGLVIGVLIAIIASYMYRDHQIKRSYERIDQLTQKIDSLSAQIKIKENERQMLEEQVNNKKLEIQEITIVKYIRPKFNSADSSFRYLKGLLK